MSQAKLYMRANEEEGVLVFQNGEGNIPDPETMISITWQISALPTTTSTFQIDTSGNITMVDISQILEQYKLEQAKAYLSLTNIIQTERNDTVKTIQSMISRIDNLQMMLEQITGEDAPDEEDFIQATLKQLEKKTKPKEMQIEEMDEFDTL